MLEVSSVLEMQSLRLRFDALRILQATLCGTATTNLWGLLENFFGVDENVKEKAIAEARSLQRILRIHREEREKDNVASKLSVSKEDDQPAGDRDRVPDKAMDVEEAVIDHSDDEVDDDEDVVEVEQKEVKAKTTEPAKPQTLQQIKAAKEKYKTKCSLAEAELVYPSSFETKHQTGVEKELIGQREKLPGYKGAYECLYKDCEYAAQTRGVVCSHIRRTHLGRALGCLYCPQKAWWQARYWTDHMNDFHAGQERYQQVVLPTGPLEAVEVSAAEIDIMISEEKIIYNPEQEMKAEPMEIIPQPEEDADAIEEPIRPVKRKRRVVESSSDDDTTEREAKSPFFGPADEDCVFPDRLDVKVEVHSSAPSVLQPLPTGDDKSDAIVIEEDDV